MTHEELARHNLVLAEGEGDNPWRITKYFYAAVHAIDAKLFPGGRAPEQNYGHFEREKMLRDQGYRDLYALHIRLKNLSLAARYQPWYHPMGNDRVDNARKLAGDILKRAGVSSPTA